MPPRRTFSLEDQRAFARISGDWNPLHVDPIAARRTMFEAPVVHGIHVLVWALDAWLAAREPVSITALKVVFRKPVLLDTEVALEVVDEPLVEPTGDAAAECAGATPAAASVRILGTAAEQRVLEATLAFMAGEPLHAGAGAAVGHATIASEPPRGAASSRGGPATMCELRRAEFGQTPRFVARETIADERGRMPLALDSSAAAVMFPHACRALGEAVIAELLATTRIVGMECPGLHSVFTGLDLHRRAKPSELAIDWRVSRANLRYSVVELAVRGAVFEGTLDTFYRPMPQDGPTSEQIRDVVRAGEFRGQRALVVGGSRGLGEAIARCLAAGGADVCITYHRGAAESDRIVRDACGAPGRLAAIPLDVTGAIDLRWPFEAPPTHLYYLATPRIPSVAKFARRDLDHMLAYYVDGLLAVTGATCVLGSPIVVWAPSSSFLDDGDGSAAYCMAKAAMEELCRRLPRMLPVRVRTPRLPRIATDQTAGLVQLPAAPALGIALVELRMVAETGMP